MTDSAYAATGQGKDHCGSLPSAEFRRVGPRSRASGTTAGTMNSGLGDLAKW